MINLRSKNRKEATEKRKGKREARNLRRNQKVFLLTSFLSPVKTKIQSSSI
jgi:hypothetical protein